MATLRDLRDARDLAAESLKGLDTAIAALEFFSAMLTAELERGVSPEPEGG